MARGSPINPSTRPRPPAPGTGLGRQFYGLFTATAISATGDGLLSVAMPLLAVAFTTNPVAIAGVLATNRAAMALACLPAGVIVDHLDKRAVMTRANLVSGALLIALVLAMALGAADLAMVYVASAVIAVCDITYTLAMQAVVPDVVGSSAHLGLANGRLTAVDGAGEQCVGPAAGGTLFALSRWVPFLGDGASFFASAALVRSSVPRTERKPGPLGFREGAKGLSRGLAFFRGKRALKLLSTNFALLSFAQSMVFGLLVIYGKYSLHLSSGAYGVFLSGAAAFGVAGAAFGGRLLRRFGPGKILVGGMAAAVCSYLALALATSPVLGAVAFGAQEAGVAIANVGSITTRQMIVPREIYGRVNSVHRFLVLGAAPLGAVTGGLVASWLGTRAAIAIAGAVLALSVGTFGPMLLQVAPKEPESGGPARAGH